MFKLLSSVVCGALSLLLCVQAADPVFKMGSPTFFGSGCPAGTLEIVPSDDGQSVSMLFSSFAASTTPTLLRDRKTCNLAVPVSVPSGISVGIFKVDYRGYAYVPSVATSRADFQADYFFAGIPGPTFKTSYTPGFDDNILNSNTIGVAAVTWSPCGASTILRVNTAITALKATGTADETMIEIDTTDITVQQGLRFYMTYRTC